MVVAVEGSVISVVEMDSTTMGGGNRGQGMQGFGNFNAEDFTMPEGMTMPQWGGGERPEGMPEGFDGMEMPEGFTMPEGMPEDFTMPEGGMPGYGGNFFGGNGERPQGGERPQAGERPEGGKGQSGFAGFSTDVESKQVDISKAHISVQIDGGKESGSLEDIKAGTYVTITISPKGEATYVLITSRGGFGGRNNGK